MHERLLKMTFEDWWDENAKNLFPDDIDKELVEAAWEASINQWMKSIVLNGDLQEYTQEQARLLSYIDYLTEQFDCRGAITLKDWIK